MCLIGAIGSHNSLQNITFNQLRNETDKTINLPELAKELAALRSQIRKEACDPEHDIAIGALANAEMAAREGDESKVIEHLKTAGKWALSCAEKIGTGVAVAAIKFSLGI